jgi:hypothetical protein
MRIDRSGRVASGAIEPVIDRLYPLREVLAAHERLAARSHLSPGRDGVVNQYHQRITVV